MEDSKKGLIKDTFLRVWLKENSLDKVILQSKELRKACVLLLKQTIKYDKAQDAAYKMAAIIATSEAFEAQAKETCYSSLFEEITNIEENEFKEIREQNKKIFFEATLKEVEDFIPSLILEYEFETFYDEIFNNQEGGINALELYKLHFS